MDFLIDVHLPVSLSKFLDKQPNCKSIHVNQILNKWHTSDAEICQYADENDLIVISKDEDFKSSHFVNKTPKKLIRVTLGNISNVDLIILFSKYLPHILQLPKTSEFYIEVGSEQIIIIN